jgi:hypothetical protein
MVTVGAQEQGCSVLGQQGELGKPHRRKQAVLGRKTSSVGPESSQHRLFQAGAALRGEN